MSQATERAAVKLLTPGMKSATVIPADTHEVQSPLSKPIALFSTPGCFPDCFDYPAAKSVRNYTNISCLMANDSRNSACFWNEAYGIDTDVPCTRPESARHAGVFVPGRAVIWGEAHNKDI